ncbi:MAG: hypothetical protein PHR35_20960 [Kiritimatiellae bacterium]|nr:hypothetical protein [Kiritimatiellia bacterium]
MNSGTLSKLGAGLLALALLAGAGARAAEYTDTTGTYSVYSLSDQTDTWTRCELTVANLYVASNANSVAELRLITTTNNINGTHEIGFAGPGKYCAESGSLIRIGASVNLRRGEFRLTDSTGVVASGKSVAFSLAPQGSTTGDVYLVRSRLEKASGGTLNIWAGWGSTLKEHGRLFATDSTLIASYLSGGYAAVDIATDANYPEGYFVFDHSVVNLGACRLGGEPSYGYNRGFLLLTNGSDMAVSGGLVVGQQSGNKYECKLIASGSRLTVGGNTEIAKNGYRGYGRVTFKDGATGLFSGNVTLGVDYTYSTPSHGYLDVLSGSRVDITNASGNATLTVGVYGPDHYPGHTGTAVPGGYGKLAVTGGSTCRVDRLVAANGANSVIALSNGTLSVRSGTISNNLTTVIGDGANPATLELWGRQPFNVTSNLVFSNKATLSVEIGGPTTNDCNYLDVHGALTFGAGSALEVNLVNGYKPGATDYITVALADTLATLPDTLPPRWIAMIVDEGGRKALKINLPPAGTVMMLR